MTSPFPDSRDEVIHGFILWPEIAEEFACVPNRFHALFAREFLD
jgi:hypothetical protein